MSAIGRGVRNVIIGAPITREDTLGARQAAHEQAAHATAPGNDVFARVYNYSNH